MLTHTSRPCDDAAPRWHSRQQDGASAVVNNDTPPLHRHKTGSIYLDDDNNNNDNNNNEGTLHSANINASNSSNSIVGGGSISSIRSVRQRQIQAQVASRGPEGRQQHQHQQQQQQQRETSGHLIFHVEEFVGGVYRRLHVY